jgi:hypothetical protein
VQALPQAAFFLFLEAAAGGVLVLAWLAVFEDVPRGFVVFTGACLAILGVFAVWLRLAFPTVLAVPWAAVLSAVLGSLALGSALVALSLGHWYLVSPSMAVRPLIRVTFVCLGALLAQLMLVLVTLVLTGPEVLSSFGIFLGVRVLFGLVIPIPAALMTWRTARIRSLDSATGLLYIVVALVLAGEITARSLFFLTGVAT